MDKSGPAFPAGQSGHPGMTLRDYFAASMLVALAGRASDEQRADSADQHVAWAVTAYQMADALMKVRAKS